MNLFRLFPGRSIWHIHLADKTRYFKNYTIGNPSFGRDNARYDYFDTLEAQTAHARKAFRVNVFVTIGELEKSTIKATQDLVSLLQRRSRSGLKLTGLTMIEDSDHSTAFPETTVRSIRWLLHIKKP